jgi:hypothetical protein
LIDDDGQVVGETKTHFAGLADRTGFAAPNLADGELSTLLDKLRG